MSNEQKQSGDEMRHEARTKTMTQEPSSEVDGTLPPEAQGLIGHQLRQEYRRILSEPLPDKFTRLLEELAQSATPSTTKSETEK